jgi:hypothetical protein
LYHSVGISFLASVVKPSSAVSCKVNIPQGLHAKLTPCNIRFYWYNCVSDWTRLLRCQLMTYTITSSPIVTRFYFQQTSSIRVPVGKRKVCSLSGRSPAPIADSFHVATMARKHIVLNLR